jgi:hypothetical protein
VPFPTVAPLACSGDIYAGVPSSIPVCVRRVPLPQIPPRAQKRLRCTARVGTAFCRHLANPCGLIPLRQAGGRPSSAPRLLLGNIILQRQRVVNRVYLRYFLGNRRGIWDIGPLPRHFPSYITSVPS